MTAVRYFVIFGVTFYPVTQACSGLGGTRRSTFKIPRSLLRRKTGHCIQGNDEAGRKPSSRRPAKRSVSGAHQLRRERFAPVRPGVRSSPSPLFEPREERREHD